MKKLGLFLVISLFVIGVYPSVKSTSAVAGDEEPEHNWFAEETVPEPEPSEMDALEDYDLQDEEGIESDESDEEGAPEDYDLQDEEGIESDESDEADAPDANQPEDEDEENY